MLRVVKIGNMTKFGEDLIQSLTEAVKIPFNELGDLVYDVRNDPSRSEVRFGCGCGCGGDSYSTEEWGELCAAAEEAKEKLSKIGITFD